MIDKRVNMVILYYFLIFVFLKCFIFNIFKERIIVKMIENRIVVYFLYMVFDVVKNGVNDWLVLVFGNVKVEFFEYLK